MEKSYQPGRTWNDFQDQNSSIVHSGRKMSKGNIFSVEIPILEKKKRRQSNVAAVYFGNQNYSGVIEYNM